MYSHAYVCFQNCVGAIDGTHIMTVVPAMVQMAHRGRHTVPTQNVMCVCDFNMLFMYVLSGWEGTTNNSRILAECVNNPTYNFPMPPEG